MEDGRCRLGLAARLELVGLVEQGASLRAAAAARCSCVAPTHGTAAGTHTSSCHSTISAVASTTSARSPLTRERTVMSPR